MNILGFEISKITNQDKKQPEQVNIYKNVVKTQLMRERQDVKKWRDALTSAESIQMPNRSPLMRVYQDIVLDAHLSALIKTRKHLLTSSPFNLYSNGEVDEEATKVVNQQWFFEFLNLALDSVFYGYEVIQFGDIKDNKFQWVKKIPEQYLVPEFGVIKKSFGAEITGIKYGEKPYDVWCISVGNPQYDFGLLNYATPLIIYKRNALGFWAQYTELFGVPTRTIQTNTRDASRRKNAEDMLDNMGSAGWGVLDLDDIYKEEKGSGSDAYNVFDKLIDRSNSEISKLILGVTMATDDGSSRSQAEVHENILKKYAISDKRMITSLINDKLLPLLKFHRIIPENINEFYFEDIDVLEVMDIETIVKDLKDSFDFNTDELTDKFGLTITKKEEQVTDTMNKVSNEYGKQYHKFQCKDFGDFKTIKNHKTLKNGIEVIGGITNNGKFELYGYNFPTDTFTSGQAKRWLKDNKINVL
jgi:hypothetical protein